MDIHANGDAAIDVALAAHEFAAADDLRRDRLTVMVHSQFVRRDQLQRYVDYRIIPSFFTSHAFYFGDAHVQLRGPEQAHFLSPMRAAIDLGLQPTNHTDFVVTPLDQMFVVWTAVNRASRSGRSSVAISGSPRWRRSRPSRSTPPASTARPTRRARWKSASSPIWLCWKTIR